MYKPGDRVRIISVEKMRRIATRVTSDGTVFHVPSGNCMIPKMYADAGKVRVVRLRDNSVNGYRLEGYTGVVWTKDMLEPAFKVKLGEIYGQF